MIKMWRSSADFIEKSQAARHFLTAHRHRLNKDLAIFDIAHRSLIYIGYFPAQKKKVYSAAHMYVHCV